MKTVTLSKIAHRGATRIRVDFPYDAEIIQAIKQIEGSRWSQTKKCWHVPYNKESFTLLEQQFQVILPQNASRKKDKLDVPEPTKPI